MQHHESPRMFRFDSFISSTALHTRGVQNEELTIK